MTRKKNKKKLKSLKSLKKMPTEKNKILIGFYNSDYNPFIKKNEIDAYVSTTAFNYVGTIATPPKYKLSITELKFNNYTTTDKTAILFKNGNFSIPLHVYYAYSETVLEDLESFAKEYNIKLTPIETAVGIVYVFLGNENLKIFINHVTIPDEDTLNYYKNQKKY